MARLRPSLAEARELARTATHVPLYREEMADHLPPAVAFANLPETRPRFLLESVEGGERLARYSFLGAGLSPLALPEGDPLLAVEAALADRQVAALPGLPPRFSGGAIGYLGYETARCYERLPPPRRVRLDVPLAQFGLTESLAIYDHVTQQLKLTTLLPASGDLAAAYDAGVQRLDGLWGQIARGEAPAGRIAAPHPAHAPVVPEANMTPAEFRAMVVKAKEYIRAGDAFQVVVSQRFMVPVTADPLRIYRCLRALNPSPYMYFLDYGRMQIIGSSPEVLVRVEGRQVETRPLAGTRGRSGDPRADRLLEEELSGNEKERAEHVMLVDLGRNDVGRVARPGTVRVEPYMAIERYSHVMHLVSGVSGTLAEGGTAAGALRACFPAGTVSGAPKIRAMEIIAELEPEERGVYAGAVGYLGFNGNLDMAIAIRTMVLVDGVAYVQAGAGIVADSDPEEEYQETLRKAGALIDALALAHEGIE
jgi:anthranilate synthase component 1